MIYHGVSEKNNCLNIPINPIVLGTLGAAHSIYGWIKVFSSTECIEDIFEYQPWFIKHLVQWTQLELEAWKYHNKNIIIKIKHINNRNTANAITNYDIIVDAEKLPALTEKTYYWKDLISCQVITTTGYSLGFVQYLIETGSNDVMIVKNNIKNACDIKEQLIPFLNEKVIKNVDLSAKIIIVDWNTNF